MANAELALTHYREAVRMYRANNLVDRADGTLYNIAELEENLRRIGIARTAPAVAAAVTKG